MNAVDQRVVRTRKNLKAAFIQLVNEQGFENTTIRDVTARAEVGYRTFFRHYKDTRELMVDALSEFVTAVHNELLPADSVETTQRNIVTMCEYIEKHSDLFRAYYRTPYFTDDSMPLQQWGTRLGSLLIEGLNLKIPDEIVLTHVLYSMLNLQRWWVENDMPLPAAQMGRYTHDLVLRPLLE